MPLDIQWFIFALVTNGALTRTEAEQLYATLGTPDLTTYAQAVLDRLEEVEGGCLLAAPLSRDCKKAGATVLPIFTAEADQNGRYFLPLRDLAVKSYTCRVLWAPPGRSWREETLELEPGRVTRLDLSAG